MIKVSDKEVWDALDVFQTELGKWRTVPIAGEEHYVWAINDCNTALLVSYSTLKTGVYTQIDFKDEATAREYICWRAVKAVLESVIR